MCIFALGCNVPRATGEGGNRPESQVADEDIIAFAKRLGFEPDQQQAEVLRSKAKRGILNCSRQWGKSTVSAVKAVHRAYTKPGSLVLVASPTARQSAEWMRKAEALVGQLGVKVRGDGHNEISLVFPNGSRIVGLPGTRTDGGVRGFSAVSLLIIDEAARVEEAMYKALRPMLAVGDGHLWMMSTPFGKRGFFYENWELGGELWHRVRVEATECERIGRDFLEEERNALGSAWFSQEYQCSFLDNGTSMFGWDLLERALVDGVDPLNVGPWEWKG